MKLSIPDVLVLGGGGVLGEAWMMGLLSGLEDAAGLDMRGCEHFVGTSAGAMVAAHLASGSRPRRPASVRLPAEAAELVDGGVDGDGELDAGDGPARPEWPEGVLSAASSLLVLGLATPAGAAARAMVLRRLPEPSERLDRLHAHVARSGSAFDGRLRVVAVERLSGRRVVFGSPDAPAASVADAVTASCTVPWRFASVTIQGRPYVDGAVWSATNLDLAPGAGRLRVLCLNPIATLGGGGAIGMLRRLACSAAWLESVSLRRRGANVQLVAPDAQSAAAMGLKLMDHARGEAVLQAGYDQGIRLARTFEDGRAAGLLEAPAPQATAVALAAGRPAASWSSIQASSSSQRS